MRGKRQKKDRYWHEDLKVGEMVTSSLIGEGKYLYKVGVRGPPKGMPGDGWKVQLEPGMPDSATFNVYEAGGETSGQGRKGLWMADVHPVVA